jgi:hypothetical protein
MRTFAFFFFAAAVCMPAEDTKESSRTVYTYDSSGRRQAVYDQANASSAAGASQSQTVVDLNGRRVQLESMEETVLSDGPEGRVVERIVKKFDAQGRLTGQEKVRLEETKSADGSSSTVRATVYDRDLNGQFALRERSTTTTEKDASATRAETVVERPNVNGNLDTQERKLAVTTGDSAKSLKDVTVYRKDQHGSLSPTVREVTETTTEGDRETANTSEYNSASTGRMELTGQKLSQTVKSPDGSEAQVVDVFGTNNPGQLSSGYNREPKLRERQVIERMPGPGKGMVETFSVQRPALDSGRLGPPQKISETVCQGNCRP